MMQLPSTPSPTHDTAVLRPVPARSVRHGGQAEISAGGVIYNGEAAPSFGDIGAFREYPDVRSFKRKFGLIVPATNTSAEHELWAIIFQNPGPSGLQGVGIHAATVNTPRPTLDSPAAVESYKRQFLDGLRSAVDAALLAQPDHLIMGMSLEHILDGLDAIKACVAEIETHSRVAWATWHDAAAAALRKFSARRIGLLTPFDRDGNRRATRMFEDLGFEVVASVGFACADAVQIAHVPDWAKERAVLELLATEQNALDAVVQCGTNMSFVQLAERLEPLVGIPMLGINAVTFWHALRQTGIVNPVPGAGRLFREF